MARKRKRRSFLRKPKGKEDMALQITAMADIFTVLLVFLLKTFSTGLTSLTPNPSIALPEAEAKDKVVEALKLEIAPTFISLDDRQVTDMKQFRFQNNDLESDGTPRSLNAALIRERAAKPRGKQSSDEEENNTKILVLADRKTPYATLKTVLDTAANHGFGDFKLVVVEDR